MAGVEEGAVEVCGGGGEADGDAFEALGELEGVEEETALLEREVDEGIAVEPEDVEEDKDEIADLENKLRLDSSLKNKKIQVPRSRKCRVVIGIGHRKKTNWP